uniref:Uncharacterized protein n=1 Tax=Paramormyrops kingsleyae TaxID=1676925 RepID=A0A3B3S6U7_9TELE
MALTGGRSPCHLTALSFSVGSSKTHLSLESMRSSGFTLLTMASMSETLGGAKMVCTINLCLLFSLGS